MATQRVKVTLTITYDTDDQWWEGRDICEAEKEAAENNGDYLISMIDMDGTETDIVSVELVPPASDQ